MSYFRRTDDTMHKEESFWKRKKIALSNYYSALLHLRSVGGMQPEGDLKQRSESQQVMIYNNMAGTVLFEIRSFYI